LPTTPEIGLTGVNMRDGQGVTASSHAWLEQLIRACEGAAARLERRNEPALGPLLEDIRALQARLQDQLDELRR
jgi:hypothetical protein